MCLGFPLLGTQVLSAEGVLSLGPSLVLGEDDMGPPEVMDQLETTGIEIRRYQSTQHKDCRK